MTDDERRRALLTRWSDLAPRETRFGEYGYLEGSNTSVGDDLQMAINARSSSEMDHALILHHALACSAYRGWQLNVVSDHKGALATIRNADMPPDTFWSELSEHPDIAVLAAYVDALEAASADTSQHTAETEEHAETR